nr:ribosomal RNA-processing protein 14-C-like [Ipomoea batatas]
MRVYESKWDLETKRWRTTSRPADDRGRCGRPRVLVGVKAKTQKFQWFGEPKQRQVGLGTKGWRTTRGAERPRGGAVDLEATRREGKTQVRGREERKQDQVGLGTKKAFSSSRTYETRHKCGRHGLAPTGGHRCRSYLTKPESTNHENSVFFDKLVNLIHPIYLPSDDSKAMVSRLVQPKRPPLKRTSPGEPQTPPRQASAKKIKALRGNREKSDGIGEIKQEEGKTDDEKYEAIGQFGEYSE